jgi:dTDP-4-dehydrorhamnose 3,5-epimerase
VTPEPTPISGLTLLRSRISGDPRGTSQKVVTATALQEAGLESRIEEVLVTTNDVAGTVRGLHYQVAPHEEAKTLWVTRGALFDVVVDLRRHEPTFGRWWSIRLEAGDGCALHIPAGLAHGYQTLEDDTRLTYLISAPYTPGAAATLAWHDSTLGIPWPREVTRISPADQQGSAWSALR